MILPLTTDVPAQQRLFFEDLFFELIAEDLRNRKIGTDIVLNRNDRVILVAPDGGKWALTVNNSGTLTTVAA